MLFFFKKYPIIMEKMALAQLFAKRLRDTLIAAGFDSQRSSSGVDIDKLAEITGYSTQICRKYLRGQAIPEPTKLVDIALKLNVSPGWLLFGDGDHKGPYNTTSLTIHKKLLHYIFSHAGSLYSSQSPVEDISNFLLDLTNDISQIQANEEQSKRIIDLALSSATYFKTESQGKA